MRKKSKRIHVSAISFFYLRVAENERDWISFHILYPTIYSSKSFKSLKSY